MAEEAENVGVEEAPKKQEIDYKALYEKLQKDNASLSKYTQDLKEKYQAKLTDEEKLRAENEERENYYKKLEKELSISKYKSNLSSRVDDEKTLNEMANRFADGDSLGGLDLLLKYEKNKEENLKKSYEQNLLAQNPTPPPASDRGAGEITDAQFKKMGYQERVELKAKNPELYEKLAKK